MTCWRNLQGWPKLWLGHWTCNQQVASSTSQLVSDYCYYYYRVDVVTYVNEPPWNSSNLSLPARARDAKSLYNTQDRHLYFVQLYIGCVLFQNLTNLGRSRFVSRDQSSPVKKNADLSGRSGSGHLVLVCTEHCRPRPLLQVNKLCRQHIWLWLSQIFSDVSEQIRFDWERRAFRSDRSRFARFWKKNATIVTSWMGLKLEDIIRKVDRQQREHRRVVYKYIK